MDVFSHPQRDERKKCLFVPQPVKMLLSLFMALILSLPAYAAVNDKISLQLTDTPMSKALEKVEEVSGYKLAYTLDDVQPYRVTCNFKDKNLNDAMKEVLRNTPLGFEVKGQFVTVFSTKKKDSAVKAAGTLCRVSGVVVDQNDEPLVGVTVMGRNKNVGVLTDVNGHFSIEVPSGDRLQFTCIGMNPYEVVVKKNDNIKVVMADNVAVLDDVVVTGYQTLSRERTTGSFDHITSEALSSRPSTDLSSALQGLVSGMQSSEKEDGSVEFLIRGTSSLYANTKPLVVVDGFPIEGDFSNINPNDVESVTVLKDAAAASIWGARSANGVIVVTTKQGKKGQLKVSAQGFYRFYSKPDLDYVLNIADSRTTVDYRVMAQEKGWNLTDFNPSVDNIATSLSKVDELYHRNKYLGLSDDELARQLDVLRNTSNRQQIEDYLMQTRAVQQYNISLSGGTERLTSYASILYEKSDEATIKRGYERFMLNFNNTYKFSSRLTGTLAGTFHRKTQDNTGVTLSSLSSLEPYTMLVNADGSYVNNSGSINSIATECLGITNLPYSDTSYNVLREVNGREYKTKTSQYRVNAGLNFLILDGFTFDTKFQYEHMDANVTDFDSEDTEFVRYCVNYYCKYNYSNNSVTTRYLPMGGMLRRSYSDYNNYVWRNQLSFIRSFGPHDIAALAGFEMSQYKTATRSYPYALGYNPDTNTSQPPSYGASGSIATIDDWYSYMDTFISSKFSDRVDRFFSYFGNASYVYDGRYGVSFSIRSDGSNYVTEDKSLRWSPMWSLGARWNISNENFMNSTTPWLDRLTLRATYGINGNSEKSTSPQTLISTSANSVTGTNVSSISSYGNPLLRWEETYTTNLGIDFSLWHGLFSGKVEYYNKLGKYIVGTVTVPSVYGSSTQRYNNAEILNRGFEAEITGKGRINSIGLGIHSTATFSYNYNEVKKLFYPSMYCYQYTYVADPSNGYFVEGKPVGAVYSYEYGGMKDGVPQVVTPDGELHSFNDLELHLRTLGNGLLTYGGSTISPYTFGWANRFTWKGFDLYIYLNGKFGGVFRAPNVGSIPLADSKSAVPASIVSMMNSDGVNYPTLPADGDYMCYRWDRYLGALSCDVESASFIRLKEISLSYNIPSNIMRKIYLSGARVFFQARDLGLLYTANKYNYDPEWLPGTNKPSANFTFGATINF